MWAYALKGIDMLEINMTGKASVIVDEANTAATVGSGSLRVFATPSLAALIEKAACNCLLGRLEEGTTSVGTVLDIKHMAATPVGMKAEAIVTLVEIDGRRLVFDIIVNDEKDRISEGVHERFIVNSEKFMSKVESKLG